MLLQFFRSFGPIVSLRFTKFKYFKCFVHFLKYEDAQELRRENLVKIGSGVFYVN